MRSLGRGGSGKGSVTLRHCTITDGKCDIGAVEYTWPETNPTTLSAPSGK